MDRTDWYQGWGVKGIFGWDTCPQLVRSTYMRVSIRGEATDSFLLAKQIGKHAEVFLPIHHLSSPSLSACDKRGVPRYAVEGSSSWRLPWRVRKWLCNPADQRKAAHLQGCCGCLEEGAAPQGDVGSLL